MVNINNELQRYNLPSAIASSVSTVVIPKDGERIAILGQDDAGKNSIYVFTMTNQTFELKYSTASPSAGTASPARSTTP